jgi:hypothetical protein
LGFDQAHVPKVKIMMNDSLKRHDVKITLLRPRDHFGPWPISAGELVSLIDLGWSDNRIACHFGVEPVKVFALRAHHGLIDHVQDSWIWQMRERNRLQSEE